MSKSRVVCACDRFERLEGVAAQAYMSQFLERTGTDDKAQMTYFVCRICGTPWVRTEVDGQRKASLVRQKPDFNV